MSHVQHQSTELSCFCLHNCLVLQEKNIFFVHVLPQSYQNCVNFGLLVNPISFRIHLKMGNFLVFRHQLKPPCVLLTGSVYRPAVLLVCAIVKLKAYSTLPLLFPGLAFGGWLVKGGTLRRGQQREDSMVQSYLSFIFSARSHEVKLLDSTQHGNLHAITNRKK